MNSSIFLLFSVLLVCLLVCPTVSKKPSDDEPRLKADKSARRSKAFKKNIYLKPSNAKSSQMRALFDETTSLLSSSSAESVCRPSTCILIDGSRSLSPLQFSKMKGFAELLVDVLSVALNLDPEYSAVQYGNSIANPSPISQLTTDEAGFLQDMEDTESRNDKKVWMVGGLEWCIEQELAASTADTKNLVMLAHVDSWQGSKPWAILDSTAFMAASDSHRVLGGIIGHNSSTTHEEEIDYLVDLVGGVNSDVKRYKKWDELAEKIKCFAGQICDIPVVGCT